MFATRISVSEIREGRDEFIVSIAAGNLGIAFRDSEFKNPAEAKVQSFRTGLEITFLVTVRTIVNMRCARCLCDFEESFVSTFELHLKALRGGPGFADFAEEDFAFIDKDKGIVDLKERIIDEVILELPQIPLCREDCPGIEYDSGEDTDDERWRILKKLKQ